MAIIRQDPKSKASRKVSLASFIGTTIEWYDFYLFGTASALFFNILFFPKISPVAGIMAAYATYAVGFFARPLGGLIFGHFGDKVSRKKMLVFTLCLMGGSTFLIGLLPTYEKIGIFAPLLLVILRCIQGIAVGGEWAGAVVMSAEVSREKERGFYSSWPNSGAPFGLVISIAIFLVFTALPKEQFLSWGWRVPFLLSFIVVLVGLYIRLQIMESKIFVASAKNKRPPKTPALEMLHSHFRNFLLAIGARLIESASFYVLTVFILSYGTLELHLSKAILLYAVMTGAIFETLLIPYFGSLSDRIGRRPVYITGALLMALFAFPFFWLLQTKNPVLIFFAVIFGMCIPHAMMHGAQGAFYSELFNTRIRYSGTAIAYHLSAALSGGLAPLIATGLVEWAHGNTWPVSVYLIILAVITIISIYLSVESAQKDISG
ncbi:MHS family MFS transporter [Fluoribacter gormanii]|uniref:Inner membrane metabolite transport protein yhjE n=1 Tax=Fluoribacter gormanii TaxID=464 RepID=A0A377GID5_9GAMM|nr:MFS transporter [Fluoribacter gormanii]KTD03572.1 shikimate transporter [Fluoribacter gormanii]MCW8443840.1 MHS family MFS transporter [Fluoribacter gormanii]MCW8472273.1 MHS family MFS transporter [Fluoribacter gormanii]SIQ42527.1 metabolite-proton symporter [Fluoribacter gormanii]STO24600.1 Inner membrane metabolite transport protein yhjE [Fluoribacter gormanii]